MRILFIYPRMHMSLALGTPPPIAVLSLASFIKREGHEVHIYDRCVDRKCVSLVIESFKPNVVVCTLMFGQQIMDMQTISREIRTLRPDLSILCGGLTASLFPELILKEGLADYVGIGEGEYTLLELLEVVASQRKPSAVQSLVYLDQNNQPIHTPLRPFADLSDFPNIEYSLVPMNDYFSFFPGAPRMLTVYASKGCPGQCTFCFNAAYHRRQYRVRKRESVMQEIESLVTEHDADGILFFDELWGVDKKELRAYCGEIAALSEKLGKPIRWFCETRIGVLSFEDMRLMANAGCAYISYGLDSGSPEILKRVKKEYPLEKVIADFDNCKALGIDTIANIIFGYPGETPAQIKQTVHTIFQLNPTDFWTGLFYAAPGTEEYDNLILSGRIQPPANLTDWAEMGDRHFLTANYSAIADRELKVIHYFFYWRMLFQKKKTQHSGSLRYLKMGFQLVSNTIGQKGFFQFFYKNFLLVLSAAWYYFAFPAIRRKYDLYARNFGRKDWDDLGHLDAD